MLFLRLILYSRYCIYFISGDSHREEGILRSHEYFYKCEVGDDKLYICSFCESVHSEKEINDRRTCPSCSCPIDKKNFSHALEVRRYDYYFKFDYPRSDAISPEQMLQVGHTFSFGTSYSDKLGSCYVDVDCNRAPLHMCSYGIGISRLIAAVAESLATDEDELRWPLAIAPYSVCIITPKVRFK